MISLRRRRRTRLGGWWHQQKSAGQRWSPTAWKMACDLSTKNSRARRGKEA